MESKRKERLKLRQGRSYCCPCWIFWIRGKREALLDYAKGARRGCERRVVGGPLRRSARGEEAGGLQAGTPRTGAARAESDQAAGFFSFGARGAEDVAKKKRREDARYG